MLNRRDFLKWSGMACLASPSVRLMDALVGAEFLGKDGPGKDGAVRCINVINFIRGVEPRFATDLLLPVQKQMESILEHKLPATWLLQFDALVDPKFVDYLKANMAPNHEVGFWFEMNQKLCDAAKVAWRGRPGYEWDHLPPVAFTIGYTPEERIKLADAAMEGFKAVWGQYPASIASWNLDSITIAHLTEHYKVDAFAVCRDQIATDGFTIWGAPIAGYYPSKANAWSPALSKHNQINAPIFRMLGQDPVHYYNAHFKMPDGKIHGEPDTMEPVWASGQSAHFIKSFLDMIATTPTMKFAYAQLGQENSFPWPEMAEAYPVQMKALAELRDTGAVHVETMGDSGRRFKKTFKTTPVQAQIMLDDSFGNTNPAEGSVWYQSATYRADLHFRGDLPYFRDLTVYSDLFEQPYLHKATRQNEVEQRMPALLDGFHWSSDPRSVDVVGAGAFFMVNGERARVAGRPVVKETGNRLQVDMDLVGGGALHVVFEETELLLKYSPRDGEPFALSFEWDPAKAALRSVEPQRARYEWQGFEYGLKVVSGTAKATEKGFSVASDRESIRLQLVQSLAPF